MLYQPCCEQYTSELRPLSSRISCRIYIITDFFSANLSSPIRDMKNLRRKSSAPRREPAFGCSSCLHLLCLQDCRCTHKHSGIATATWETADKHRAAYLAGVAAAGKEVATVVSMERDVQNAGVAVEGLLSAIAMVNVLDRDSSGMAVRIYRKIYRTHGLS